MNHPDSMAQHIGVQVIDNKGSKDLNINFADIFNNIPNDPELNYFNKIDPYGDTVFENIEIKYLICDLEKYIDSNAELINKFIKYIDGVKKIIFIGD